MSGIAPNRSMRIVYKGFLCVGAVGFALLAALVLAGGARAAIAPGMQRAASGLEAPSEATAETPVSPGEGTGEKAPEEVQAPAGETVPVPEEPAEPAPVVPVVEEPVGTGARGPGCGSSCGNRAGGPGPRSGCRSAAGQAAKGRIRRSLAVSGLWDVGERQRACCSAGHPDAR